MSEYSERAQRREYEAWCTQTGQLPNAQSFAAFCKYLAPKTGAVSAALETSTKNAIAIVLPMLSAIATKANAADARAINKAIALLRNGDGDAEEPKKDETAARAPKPVVVATKSTTTAITPSVPKKEGTTMTTKTKATAQEAIAKCKAWLARTDLAAKERADIEGILADLGAKPSKAAPSVIEQKHVAEFAKIDRRLGIVKEPIAVQNGVRFGLRAMSPDEARAEIARRNDNNNGARR